MQKRVVWTISFTLAMISLTSCYQKEKKTVDQFTIAPDIVENKPVPKQDSTIKDIENLFDETGEKQLKNACDQIYSKSGHDIYILTLDNIEPWENFTEFSDAVAERWTFRNPDKGIVILISAKLQELRLISGSATEEIIGEETLGEIINEDMFPEFRESNYLKGTMDAINKIATILNAH